jgi:hypothetical protein
MNFLKTVTWQETAVTLPREEMAVSNELIDSRLLNYKSLKT